MPNTMPTTSVRFVEQRGVLSVVELRATGQPELLAALSNVLFRERVQVVRFQTKIKGSAIVGRLTIVEHDGAPIDPKRRLELQAAIFTALDGVARPPRAKLIPKFFTAVTPRASSGAKLA